MQILDNLGIPDVFVFREGIPFSLTPGAKTTCVLVIKGRCVGRFDVPGVSKGSHRIAITDDRPTFRDMICQIAPIGTKITIESVDGKRVHSYRVGAERGSLSSTTKVLTSSTNGHCPHFLQEI